MNWKNVYKTLIGILLSGFLTSAWAQEEVCAEVKIEIMQELTLERQGFEAIMRITNSLDTFPLEDINVTVNFTDDQGAPVIATSNTAASDAAFFIRVDTTRNVTGLQTGADGAITDGTITQGSQGEIRWLIVPTSNAAGQTPTGKLFFVGAVLSYSYGGEEERVEVAPDSIVVKPQPLLSLDYFLTQEIIGDDAFTTTIEPSEPYTLGVRVSNNGYGLARQVNIESAQPRIVENEQGLAINFEILSSYINDQSASPTLLINFGDIESDSVSVGRWIMQTSLSGEFTEFTASFIHADELGGELTSLLESTQAHFLIKDVVSDAPGRDTIKDFLAPGTDGEIYIYESQSTGLDNSECSDCAVVNVLTGSLSGNVTAQTLSTTANTGYSYIKLPDPFAGSQVITSAYRSDGKLMDLTNVWISKERADDNISFDYFINLFDFNGTDRYTLNFGDQTELPQPPVIQAINPRTTHEGGSVGFLVQSSDPNNTIPSLTASSLPTGSTFTDSGNGSGVFHWDPTVGQAGSYTVNFQATDGVLTAQRNVSITVNSENDRDGDNLDDQWELDNFGNLDRDGRGDFDNDGRTDLEEYQVGTNPLVAETAPGDPQIAAPIYDGEILEGGIAPLLPTLTVTNAADNGSTSVSYRFEVYADAAMSRLVAVSVQPEAATQTTWAIQATDLSDNQTFQDNTLYYWRARAEADEAGTTIPSQWVNARFFINTNNDEPAPPMVNSPANDAIASGVRPALIVSNAVDIDRDNLTYGFDLYDAADTMTPIQQINGIFPGAGGTTQWQVVNPLSEDASYSWQAWVEDEHGARVYSDMSYFLVSVFDGAPTDPVINQPINGSTVTNLINGTAIDLSVINSQDPEQQPVTYFFELDTVNTFDSIDRQRSQAIAEGISTTTWQAETILEDTQYYWRVRASDGVIDTPWINGSFFVSIANQAPPTPTLNNPSDQSVVTTLRPLFDLNPVTDPDGDAVQYRFEIYSDAALSNRVGTTLTSNTQWAIDFDLLDNTPYYWRAQSQDTDAATSDWSSVNQFYVNENNVDDEPQFTFVLPDEAIVLSTATLDIQWTDSDPDSSATIDLYYVDSNDNAFLIVSGLNEDNDGTADTYTWDVSSLAPDTYTLRADIADDSTTVSATGCCTITVPLQQKSITVTATTPLTTDESGEPWVEVQVVLDQPLTAGASVTLNLSVSDTTEIQLLSDSYLSFADSNWDQPQSIWLKGVDDCDIDGDQTAALVFATVASTDPAYDGITLNSLDINNTDNETVGQTLFICHYEVVSEVAAGNNLVETEYRPILRNTDAPLSSASAQLTLVASSDPTAVLDLQNASAVTFTNVLSNTDIVSDTTIVLLRDPTQPLDEAKLIWAITPGDSLPDDLNGDDNDNTLRGTDNNDIIDGRGGNDTLRAGAGDDTVIGGSGADRMFGEAGNDVFLIEGNDPYADRVNGGDGYDRIQGGNGDDAIRLSYFARNWTVEEIDGRGGNNIIYGTANRDTLDFTQTVLINIDHIDALAGDDVVRGSQGNDVIRGNRGNDNLFGNAGDDTFLVSGNDPGGNRFNGGDGNDQILGSDTDDVLRLRYFAGDNTVESIDLGAGNNWIEGTEGNDRLDFTHTTLTNVQYIDGLAGDDILTGSQNNDIIIGNTGNDQLFGSGGDDIFRLTGADTGFDLYNGGDGNDILQGTLLDDIIRLRRFAGDQRLETIDGDGGVNIILGSSDNNTLNFTDTQLVSINHVDAGEGNDRIYGSSANDRLIGGLGSDILYGNAGDDTFVITPGDTGFDRYDGGDGIDQIDGTPGDDLISLALFDDDYRVEVINGYSGHNRIVGDDNNNRLNFVETQLNNIHGIYGFAGNDQLEGSVAADLIVGGDGNDYLYGHGGDDVFQLDANDTGFDRYNGGDGDDRLEGTDSEDLFRIAYFSGVNSVETIDGLGGNNRIQGDDSNNRLDFTHTELININSIHGGAGNDRIYGSEAGDTLVGGPGNDSLVGNGGDDTFILTANDQGYNRYTGGDGTDTIMGTLSDDLFRLTVFSGDNTVERINGNGGNDRITGSSGNNRLDFSATELIDIQAILGDEGNDSLIGNDQNNTLIGGFGNDTLFGNGGDDRFLHTAGDTGFDRYAGGDGTDILEGTDGDDIFRLSNHSGDYVVDIIDGQGGTNTIEGSPTNNVLDFSHTQLLAIQHIHGRAGNDTLYGSQGDDVIIGGLGSDYLLGNGGNDRFIITAGDTGYDRYNGGDGIDTLVGTDQDDRLRFAKFNGQDTVEIIDGGQGSNSIQGSAANNVLDFTHTQLINITVINGLAGNDRLYGSADNNILIGGPGNDNLYGGEGDDQFQLDPNDAGFDRYYGGLGNDTLLGTTNSDVFLIGHFRDAATVETIDGRGGNDIIEGGVGNNRLNFANTQLIGITAILGQAGNDVITGSQEDDVIEGGLGDDKLYGQNGADTYRINTNEGSDQIRDNGTDTANDSLRFDSTTTPADLWFYRRGNALTLYRLGADNRVTIPCYYSDPTCVIETITIDGGLSLDTSTIDTLVNLMTSIGEPVNGTMTLTTQQQQQVTAAIGAVWQ